MQTVSDISIFEHNGVNESTFWNLREENELLLHRIHAYPAKFPPFLAKKLIEHFESLGKSVQLVADVFCGCGTSALESARLGKDFWGCDINPVATLIARTKSRPYRLNYLSRLYQEILDHTGSLSTLTPACYSDNERLKYWFDTNTIHSLYHLFQSILMVVPKGKYRDFFLTAFSNILKPCSRWLTKSIKPQIDPKKIPTNPLLAFDKQIKKMIKAVDEALRLVKFQSQIDIVNRDILSLKVRHSFADLVITSPPYVTSYEYADIHQLSAIWLGYTDDYRRLRRGSIGSEYHFDEIKDQYEHVNQAAKTTYDGLIKLDDTKARAVLRYFYDVNLSVQKVKEILKEGGCVAFIIGNTSYKGVLIDNAKILAQCMLDNKFKNVQVSKRKISYKNLTPYRNKLGRFTSNANGRKVYSHEYVLIAEK
jgi:methylase of polypeptide subunit release factors